MRVPLSMENPECCQARILRANSGFSKPFWRNGVMTSQAGHRTALRRHTPNSPKVWWLQTMAQRSERPAA
jgi:hypothetical protein